MNGPYQNETSLPQDASASLKQVIQEVPPKVEIKSPIDVYLETISTNVDRLLSSPLTTDIVNLPSENGVIKSSDDRLLNRFNIMTEIRALVDASQVPSRIFATNIRNRGLAEGGLPPISEGSFVHGMPIEFANNPQYGLLSGDFYRGKIIHEDPLVLYLSQILAAQNTLSGLSPTQIIEGTMTKWFMGEEGNITFVLSQRADFLKRLPTRPFVPDHINKLGMPMPVSIGVNALNITGAIAYTPKDIETGIGIFSKYPFYVPLYDGGGKPQFPFASWLSAQKK